MGGPSPQLAHPMPVAKVNVVNTTVTAKGRERRYSSNENIAHPAG